MRRTLWGLLIAAVAATPNGARAQFTPGNVTVLRVGTGAALSNASTALGLYEYNGATPGAPTYTFDLPSTGASAITSSGSATSEGLISRSADGGSIVVPGYNTAAGLTGVASSTTAAVPRGIGTVSYSGTYNLAGTTTNYSGNNVRGATSDGTNYWAAGANTGITLVPGTTIVSSTSVNNRAMDIQNGQLYFSTGSGTNRGVYAVGTGVPTAEGTTATVVVNTGAAASSYQFAFSPGPLAAGSFAYVADDRTTGSGTANPNGGIQRWNFDGTTWALAYTLSTDDALTVGGTDSGARGLAVDFSGANPVLYATSTETSANRLLRFVDLGAGSAYTVLNTADTNTIFRGVALSPFAPVPEPTTVLGLSVAALGLARLARRKFRSAVI